jgi:integrase
VGLISATGLRLGEALALRLGDVEPGGVLRIRNGKNGKERLLPMHPSAVSALDVYLEARTRVASVDDHMFLSSHSGRISCCTAEYTFRRMLKLAHITPQHGLSPRIHDIRHSFATTALEACTNHKQSVGRHMVALATYLGHCDIANTYWYLEATPVLMSDIASAAEALFKGEKP